MREKPIRVYMLDLLPTVPYYTGYLCDALSNIDSVQVDVGAANYYLDLDFFPRRGIVLDPRLIDGVSGLPKIPAIGRRILKVTEYLANLFSLLRRFRQQPPDVLHVQFLPMLTSFLPAEIWFLNAVKRIGIKIVYTVHNVLPQDNGGRHKSTYQECYDLADHLICHNQESRQRLLTEFAIPVSKISTIAHGPLLEPPATTNPEALRARLGMSADESLVLWQGIIKPYKGISFLLKAWKLVQENGTKAKLLIAGNGDSEIVQQIRKEIQTLGIKDSVFFDARFLSVAEVADCYTAADVITFPYSNITTSGALMTGICYGKAIIATRQPGFAKTIQHGHNSLIVDYGDTETFAQQLQLLLNDPSLRARLGGEARKTFLEGPQWDSIAIETSACYQSVYNDSLQRNTLA